MGTLLFISNHSGRFVVVTPRCIFDPVLFIAGLTIGHMKGACFGTVSTVEMVVMELSLLASWRVLEACDFA
jgi:hypothetical protein